jgi:hypothetical protein
VCHNALGWLASLDIARLMGSRRLRLAFASRISTSWLPIGLFGLVKTSTPQTIALLQFDPS